MGKITQHFTTEEFERSANAAKYHIDNRIPDRAKPHIEGLCRNVLEPLRQAFRQVVQITSGYRSLELNRIIGGVAGSQHCQGMAADIRSPDGVRATHMRWFVWIMDNCIFDQLIWEKGGSWIHVSYRADGKNRQQVLFS